MKMNLFMGILSLTVTATSHAFPLRVPPPSQPHSATVPQSVLELRKKIQISLASLYTVEKMHYEEFRRYTDGFLNAGWNSFDDKAFYQLGFLTFTGEKQLPQSLLTPAAKGISISNYARYCKADCQANAVHFEAMLVLPIDDKNHFDVWTIDDEKNIELRHDGLKD